MSTRVRVRSAYHGFDRVIPLGFLADGGIRSLAERAAWGKIVVDTST